MPWFKTINNNILRLQGSRRVALGFGTDSNGKEIVIGPQAALEADTLFTNGSSSHYGIGSIVMLAAGGLRIVDGDGLWQTPTITTASQSASPSRSTSPSSSTSPSVSPSHSASPST